MPTAHHRWVVAFAICMLLLSIRNLLLANPEGGYTYFGKIPEKIWMYAYTRAGGWQILNQPVSSFLLAIGAMEDGTHVEVLDLATKQRLLETMLNKFEKRYLVLSNGTLFKVASSKPVVVLLLNLQSPPNATVGPVPHAFYPSLDGSYVGRRFIVLASCDLNPWYTIFALEDSEITVAREDGAEKLSFKLRANEYRRILLRAWYMYEITSSGYIMVQSGDPHSYWDPHESYAIPSANGGFVGTDFFSYSNPQWDPREDVGFRVFALDKPVKVTVYDLEKRAKMAEFELEAFGSYRFQAVTQAIRISSDNPIQAMLLHEGDITKMAGQQANRENAYGAGIVFYTVPAGKKAVAYLPANSTGEILVFASEPTRVVIDDLITVTLKPDEVQSITQPGLHTIVADKNVVVEIMHWPKYPDFQGLWVSGTVIPAVEAAAIAHTIELKEVGTESTMSILYVAAAAALIAAGAAFLLLRRKKKTI